jgi:ABC-type transport system substrate-binding protein
MAVDRESLAEEVLKGMVSPGTGGFLVPGVPGHSPAIGTPFDPAQAQQLLQQAGYPEGRGFPNLNILMMVWNKPFEYLVEQWSSHLNVDIGIEIVSESELINRFREMELAFLSKASSIDPDREFKVIQYLQPHWKNERFDQTLALAVDTRDRSQRIQLWQKADRILIEEVIVMPVTYRRRHYLVKPWVKMPAMWLQHCEFKNLIMEGHPEE